MAAKRKGKAGGRSTKASTKTEADALGELPDIETVLHETRVFEPPADFAANAHVSSAAMHRSLTKAARKDPQGFWGRLATERLEWAKPYKEVLRWKAPNAKWFVGGKLNASVNCVDRHAASWRKNKAAIIWEGENGDERVLTYGDLLREVSKCANVLKDLGIKKGDRVVIYMPMIPELAIAMLACARIGATHSIVFGGFSSEALSDRINDAGAKAVITADGGWRRGSVLPLKEAVDKALKKTKTVEAVLVAKRTGNPVKMKRGRDHWWHERMENASPVCKPTNVDSEHPLYILYTSGTTGKPKGIVHSTAGYLLQATVSSQWVFDLKEDDTYWCTADIGWVTGHSYIVYGILSNGATTVMYEGAPNFPDAGRFWEIVEKHRVSIFYTAPTAIRAFMKWGKEWPRKADLSSIRLLGTVGEPINPEAWMWYRKEIGGNRCPIVDTWWQTETGSIMITPLPGAVATKPGSGTLPFPGIVPEIVTREGKPVKPGDGGFLVLRTPWPSMLRGIWGDPKRFKEQYWSQVPGSYFTGDGARMDEDGYFWIMGRVDDVINVSGHRLGTMEIESALVSHKKVAEAAVVPCPHEIKGQGIVAFVTLEGRQKPSEALKVELKKHVVKEIGALARPDQIRFAEAVPKTRSGKIMRRLLRDIAAGKHQVGDTSTLEDYSVIAKLREENE